MGRRTGHPANPGLGSLRRCTVHHVAEAAEVMVGGYRLGEAYVERTRALVDGLRTLRSIGCAITRQAGGRGAPPTSEAHRAGRSVHRRGLDAPQRASADTRTGILGHSGLGRGVLLAVPCSKGSPARDAEVTGCPPIRRFDTRRGREHEPTKRPCPLSHGGGEGARPGGSIRR